MNDRFNQPMRVTTDMYAQDGMVIYSDTRIKITRLDGLGLKNIDFWKGSVSTTMTHAVPFIGAGSYEAGTIVGFHGYVGGTNTRVQVCDAFSAGRPTNEVLDALGGLVSLYLGLPVTPADQVDLT